MPVSRAHAPRTHEARTDARRKPGTTRQVAELSGTGGLRFRAVAVISRPGRYGCRGTANAVGPCGPPGFKSPILRCDQQFRPGAPSRGTAGVRFPGPLRGHRRHRAARLPPRCPPPRGPCQARHPGRLAPITNRPAVMSARHGGPGDPSRARPGSNRGHQPGQRHQPPPADPRRGPPAGCLSRSAGPAAAHARAPGPAPPRRRPDRPRQAHRSPGRGRTAAATRRPGHGRGPAIPDHAR